MRCARSLAIAKAAPGAPARARFLLAAGTLLVACGSSTTSSTVTIPTLVLVEPASFVGALPCVGQTGGFTRYVATLQDVSPNLFGDAGLELDADVTADPDEAFGLPSSTPTPCHQPVGFARVVAGHKYVADIDAYDRTDLTPAAPGSRVMVSSQGEVVTPRWTTDCGKHADLTGAGPAICVSNWMVRLAGCRALASSSGSGTATITVGLSAALGALQCGNEPGQVARFTVTPTTPDGSEQNVESCQGTAVFPELEADRTYTFTASAYEAGGSSPRWRTTCSAPAIAGTTVAASCGSLGERGSLLVDLATWLSSAGLACDPAVVTELNVTVFGADGVLHVARTAPSCDPASFEALAPGVYEILVSTSTPGGAGPTGRCEATVLPGVSTTATCDPLGA